MEQCDDNESFGRNEKEERLNNIIQEIAREIDLATKQSKAKWQPRVFK